MPITEAELCAKLEQVVGVPYQVGADGPDLFDCYGLARWIQSECFGVPMPSIERTDISYTALAKTMLKHEDRRHWIQVDTPEHGDLILMGNVDGRDFHLGTYIMVGCTALCIHTDGPNDGTVGGPGVMVDDVVALGIRGFHSFRYLRHYSLMTDV